jgi:hypothetical protein
MASSFTKLVAVAVESADQNAGVDGRLADRVVIDLSADENASVRPTDRVVIDLTQAGTSCLSPRASWYLALFVVCLVEVSVSKKHLVCDAVDALDRTLTDKLSGTPRYAFGRRA